jgi:hypothetical protein
MFLLEKLLLTINLIWIFHQNESKDQFTVHSKSYCRFLKFLFLVGIIIIIIIIILDFAMQCQKKYHL